MLAAMTPDSLQDSPLNLLARHPRATLIATILGSSMALIDGSVVNVALPSLAHDLAASPAQLSWTINAYLLPLGALTLLGGALGDYFGRRRLFLAGLAIFTLASLLCAIAPGLAVLLAGRALQGLGAALLMPNSLAILGAAFQGQARGRAIGTWAAVGALAAVIGPLMGGWLVDNVGWRAIFLVNLPIAGVTAWLAIGFVDESLVRQPQKTLDWAGAALVTLALGLLTLALTESAARDSVANLALAAAVAGLILLAGFIRLEALRGAQAILPLVIFSTPEILGLTLVTWFLYASLGGLMVLLPYLLIEAAHYSAVSAGAALLPLPIVIGLGSRLMGQMAGRFGARIPLAAGSAIIAAGLALYARIGTGGIDYWSDIFPPTLLVAIGFGTIVAPLTTAVMASVDAARVGIASGFNSAVARIAGLVATALLGLVFARQGSVEGLEAGMRAAALVGAASAAGACLCALALIHDAPG